MNHHPKAPKRKQEESYYTPYRGCLILKVSENKYCTCRKEFSSLSEAMFWIDSGYNGVAELKKKELLSKAS